MRCLVIAAAIVGLAASLNAGESLPEQIRAAQSSGNYARAANLYLQFIAQGNNSPEVRSNCGLMLHLAGRNKEALEQFQMALKEDPNLAAANLFAGMSELDLEKPKAALPYLLRAQQLDPYRPAPQIALGKVYVALTKYEQANKAYSEAVALDSHVAEAWYGLGVTDRSLAEQILNRAAHEGNARSAAADNKVKDLLDQAVQALSKAVELDPNSARTHLLIAESLSDAGKIAESVPEFQTAMRLDPGLNAAYVGLASEYWKQHQFDDALPLLKHVLLKSRNDPEANAMMADILEHNGDIKNAEIHAKTALARKPDLIQTRIVLARVYLAERRPKLAITEINKVIAADPDGTYHFLLYRAYHAAGDERAAKEAMAQFQQIRYHAPQ